MNPIFKTGIQGFLVFALFYSLHGFQLDSTYSQTQMDDEYLLDDRLLNDSFSPSVSSNSECDFFNLCNQMSNHFDEITPTLYKKAVDVSYLNIDIDLPFP